MPVENKSYARKEFGDEVPVGEVREWLRANFETGAICPCCTRVVKMYKRRLNSNMAAAMIALYLADKAEPGHWVHLKKYLLKKKRYFSDAPALRHWGLITEKPTTLDDGNPRAGFYRITEVGRSFVQGRRSVIKHTYQYNKEILRRNLPDTSEITIHEALGDEFDYGELMDGLPDRSSSLPGEGL